LSKKNFDPTDGKAVIEQERESGMCRKGGSRTIEAPAEMKKVIKDKAKEDESNSGESQE